MSRRKQSNPKPLLKNESENPVRNMAILQQDPESISTEIDDEQSTVASDDNTLARSQSISESDKKDTPANDASPLSLETSSHSSTPVTSTTPIASPTLPIDIKCEKKAAAAAEQLNQLHTNSELPKLRLNITLASDPALQPEAKDIQSIRASAVENYETESNCDDEMRDDSASSPILVHDDNGPPPEKIRKRHDSTFRSSGNKFVVNLQQSNVNPNDIIPRVPAFICAPCGIKFSSMSTLEAHQTFYCTHSKKDTEDSNNPLKVILVDDGSSTESSATKTTVRTTKQYGCNQCSYSADKKVSLNRHMRMHQTSPTNSSVTSNGDDCSSQIQQPLQQQQPIQLHQVDRYCTDCDIRFSNTKTFRAHKEFYCRGRHSRHDDSGPPTSAAKTVAQKTVQPKSTEENSKFPESIGPTQPFLALPTTPIIIIPYSLIRGANVLPGPLSVSAGVVNPDLNCYVLQNGSLQPIAQAISMPSISERATKPSSTRAQTPVAKTSSQPSDSEVSPNHLDTTKNSKRRETHNREGNTTPLDLSVRRLSIDRSYRERSASISSSISGDLQRINMDALNDGKENLLLNSSNSASPEQIVCAPSLPGSPPLTPSPKRSSSSPRGILTLSPSSLASSLHLNQPNSQAASTILRPLLVNELTARLAEPNSVAAVLNSSAQHLLDSQNFELALNIAANANNVPLPIAKTTSPISAVANVTKKPIISASATLPLVQPQIFVKQGVSKCKECNIVFCKYENYLAHKKHYCSSRNIEENSDGKTKPSPPTSPLAPANSTNASAVHGAYQQLICAACGIKFTSLDNLQAHQMYYCPKRMEAPAVVRDKCAKCKTIHDAAQPCATNQNIYKCPICDVVSANATESRKHLETHAGAKAFRCSICGYKGNTLRGMRTHIRMHFDKKTNDFNEESYISCTLDEENSEAHAQTATLSSSVSTNQASSPEYAQSAAPSTAAQTHHCDKCSYSSSFKGNLIRHMKIAHSTGEPVPPSLIGEGDESLLCETEAERPNSARVIVKSEPPESKSLERPPSVIQETNDAVANNIKIENVDISDNEDDEKNSDVADSDSVQRFLPENSLVRTSLLSGVPAPGSISLNASTSEVDNKYCRICDIKFKYMSSYIAHKKSYCRNMESGLDIGPVVTSSPVSSVIASTRSSPNQASVVT
ncbi:zinc finger protein ush isoform X2 [Sitodiplosis mosellana]|uniref:zinc finger protein ush isoform X2 n=1 Tax=Sitodiplosis mosellana TaxID=263140 RepID=UPI0024451002|nr:zinc finger protein ush isoform X2 [Sitodiplosis mosellana]